jgi:signal transduction histidine kinase
VEDTGPGFAPADDEAPHIALANIQQRLEIMCGGKLTVMPREGGGTVVKITLPVLQK